MYVMGDIIMSFSAAEEAGNAGWVVNRRRPLDQIYAAAARPALSSWSAASGWKLFVDEAGCQGIRETGLEALTAGWWAASPSGRRLIAYSRTISSALIKMRDSVGECKSEKQP
jgi:hypothetical protein